MWSEHRDKVSAVVFKSNGYGRPFMAEVEKKPRYILPNKQLVRDIIHELAGFSPYEKRAIDLKKLGKDKLARNFLKKRLGTYKRAVQKAAQLEDVVHHVEALPEHGHGGH
jgi:hypothetical protein